MTIALPAEGLRSPRKLDLSWPVLILFAALLCVLILLPMTWLVYYSFVDRDGIFTLENFVRLATDPSFVDPLVTTVIISISSSVICCAFASLMGWLVARTDMPLGNVVRALVTASFVTPPFLGAIAWELLAAPNSGLINKAWRGLTGAEMDTYLLNIYTLPGLIFVISCYTFPYVFVLIANALDRIPGDLEDASSILGGRTWTTARRVTIPLALPALLAGALVAFLQAMTLFGSPAILAIPAGFHTMTTKIWSLFNYPPKPELAAAASVPLLVLTVALLRAEHLILGRRGYSVVGGKQGDPRLIKLGASKWAALALVFLVLMCPVFLPYGALLNATFSRVATSFVTFDNFTLRNIHFVFFELSATQLALKNTFLLGVASATIGTILALVIAYLTTRRAIRGYRALGFLATAPVAIPGIVLGVAFGAPRSRRRQPHPRLEPPAHVARHHRTAVANERDRDLVLHLRRRHPRIVGRHHAVHVGDQGDLGADLRPQRVGRPRRDLGARPDHARHHLRSRHRGQSHPRLRRRSPAQRLIHGRFSSKNLRCRDFGAQDRGARAAAAARAGAAQMRGSADRRRRPLPHRAQRGLRQGGACGLGRGGAVQRDWPCARHERGRCRLRQRDRRARRGFRRYLRRRSGACRRRHRAGGARSLRALPPRWILGAARHRGRRRSDLPAQPGCAQGGAQGRLSSHRRVRCHGGGRWRRRRAQAWSAPACRRARHRRLHGRGHHRISR